MGEALGQNWAAASRTLNSQAVLSSEAICISQTLLSLSLTHMTRFLAKGSLVVEVGGEEIVDELIFVSTLLRTLKTKQIHEI